MTKVLGIDVSDMIVTLSNGKKVANFSSPHPFTFEDGNILPAVPNEYAEKYKIDFKETEHLNGDIELSFGLTNDVRDLMRSWEILWVSDMVDVVFCPLPMIVAMRDAGMDVVNSPFRAIRITDRINKLASISKQCI